MKRFLIAGSVGAVLSVSWMAEAKAQAPSFEEMAQVYAAGARAAAYEPGFDFTYVFDGLCEQPSAQELAAAAQPTPEPVNQPVSRQTVPPRSDWHLEPARIFDNLYFVGSVDDSAWAVTTSEGIILVDSTVEYTVEGQIVEGLKAYGLDPADIRYVVLSHAHGDRYFGAKYLQDTYNARLIMSAADWDTVAKSNEPEELKPRKDMVATDGMKLTLGDTTLTLYIVPGHTPGTLATLIPLKDGNETHVGSVWGGNAFGYERYGLRYFPTQADAIRTWRDSSRRYKELAENAGADTYLSIHPHHDKTLDKINALAFRMPGDPHPFVSAEAVQNHLTVSTLCMQAQLAWRHSLH
jgi:glyoxylase-like metal-dependent hydrolase (beta-lactamase superfamily II)